MNMTTFIINLCAILILVLFPDIYCVQELLQGSYPSTLLLQNGKLFLANINGMFICDINLEQIYQTKLYEYNITTDILSKNVLIAQFQEENGMIICLVGKDIYFYDHNGVHYFTGNLPSKFDYTNSFFNLIPYKKEESNYHYIITFDYFNTSTYQNSLYFLHYKVNNSTNALINQKKFNPFYFDYPKIKILSSSSYGCQILNHEKKGKVLTCSFETDEPRFIMTQSFAIEENFEDIGDNIYAKVPSKTVENIRSLASKDGKKLLTFYIEESNIGYYFIYNLDNNTIINYEPIIENCDKVYYKFNLFYIEKTNEYILACSKTEPKFTIMKMDENFEILGTINHSSWNYDLTQTFNTFNLIYNENNEQYVFITDRAIQEPPTYTSIYRTGIYNISTNHNSNPEWTNLPDPIDETAPSTQEIEIETDNKYYLKVLDNLVTSITTNEIISGKVIDFLDKNKPILVTKEDKEINPSLYGLILEINTLKGKLKYIVNDEEIDIDTNERKFGAFRFKYYLSENYNPDGETDTFTFRALLRNISIVSGSYAFHINICKQNCSCTIDTGSCPKCVDGYGFFEISGKCIAGINICSNRFYVDNSTQFITCIEGNNCPDEYPIYNEKTKECKLNITDISTTEFIIDNNDSTNSNSESYNIIEIGAQSTSLYIEKPTTKASIEEIIKSDFNSELYNSQISSIDILTLTSKAITEEIIKSDSDFESELYKSQVPSIDILTSKAFTEEDIKYDSNSECETDKNQISSSYEFEQNLTQEYINDTNQELSQYYNDELYNNNIINKVLDSISEGKNTIDLTDFEEYNEPNKIHQLLSELIKNGNISMLSGDEDIIIKGKNIIYQITNTENQKSFSQINEDISTLDLGDCEKIIKRNISNEEDQTPLIILKIDIDKEGLNSPLVEYEVYDPFSKDKINLDICSNTKITIFSPVNLNKEEINLYEELKKQGYDLYDANDSFYQDICTQFTSDKGTDVIISDRKYDYYDENVTFCDDLCSYEGINITSKKVECSCSVKNSIDLDRKIFDKEKFLEKFYKVKDYTNYQVLFCYKLVFSWKGLKNNICFYVFIVIFILFLSSMIVNLLKALKEIDQIIFKIIQEKAMLEIFKKIIKNKKKRKKNKLHKNVNNNDVPKSAMETSNKLNFFQQLRMKYRNKDSENNNKNVISNDLKKNNIDINNNMNYKKESNGNNLKLSKIYDEVINVGNKKSSSILAHNIENPGNSSNLINSSKTIMKINNINNKISKKNKKINTNIFAANLKSSCNNEYLSKMQNPFNSINNNINPNPSKKKSKKKAKKKSNFKIKKKNNNESNVIKLVKFKNDDITSKNGLLKKSGCINEKKYINDNKNNNMFGEKPIKEKKINNNDKYIDEELNKMSYDNALLYDKRTYFKYYISLLKLKHLIILVFASNNDYNVFLLKFSLFIISISIFFALNTLFFRDSTMQNIYKNEGRFDLLYQIPQVLYSTIISSITINILKALSLSQNDLIKIRKESDKSKTKKMIEQVKKCLKIKLYLFFFIGLSLLIFCWYYITAFGAVYPNTQLHLIKDSLISFGISMLYPFLINIIPGLLRFPALKSEHKNQRCLYKVSQLIAFL